jgi:hypothetical protein
MKAKTLDSIIDEVRKSETTKKMYEDEWSILFRTIPVVPKEGVDLLIRWAKWAKNEILERDRLIAALERKENESSSRI